MLRLTLRDARGRSGGVPIEALVYDAGGHGEYQELHQVFFSAGALYLLVWDVSKPASELKIAELCLAELSRQAVPSKL